MRASQREAAFLDDQVALVEEEYIYNELLLAGVEQLVTVLFELFGNLGVEDAGSMKNACAWDEYARWEAVQLLLPGAHNRSTTLAWRIDELHDKREAMAQPQNTRRYKHGADRNRGVGDPLWRRG